MAMVRVLAFLLFLLLVVVLKSPVSERVLVGYFKRMAILFQSEITSKFVCHFNRINRETSLREFKKKQIKLQQTMRYFF